MSEWIRIRHPGTGAESVIARSALAQHQRAGWEQIPDPDPVPDPGQAPPDAQAPGSAAGRDAALPDTSEQE